MPFTDPISSVSGRDSRASNASDGLGAPRARHPPLPAAPEGIGAAGVLSMLKTSTDTGDIGALSFNHSRLPTMPRPVHSRRAHGTRPSGAPVSLVSAHHHAHSQASRVSSQWDTSSRRLGSLNSTHSIPASLLHASTNGNGNAQMSLASHENSHDSRSYSLTSIQPPQSLLRHRSAGSLRSQGHVNHHGRNVPPVPEIRPPFAYPTRLRRPGFRSPSPALSDSFAQGVPSGIPVMSTATHAMRPAPLMSYKSYASEGRYTSPPNQRHGVPPNYAFGNPSFGSHFDPQVNHPSPPPRSRSAAPGPYSIQSSASQPVRRVVQQAPAQYSSRMPRSGLQHTPRSSSSRYRNMQHPEHRGYPSPASGNVAPMAHHMFHNAARMARHLPQRIDTPINGLPSSDPPSSASAPTSSNPATPKDSSTAQVSIDPTFIDPALDSLPDSPSDPILPVQYFEYAEGLRKSVDDQDIGSPHPSVPPSGFVQRVKAMLESRAAVDAVAIRQRGDDAVLEQVFELEAHPSLEDIAEALEIHELAADTTPRFTVIEEYQAPVELPASPVEIPELDASNDSRPRSGIRITRELIKTKLDDSSADDTADHASNAVDQLGKNPNGTSEKRATSDEQIPSHDQLAPDLDDAPSAGRPHVATHVPTRPQSTANQVAVPTVTSSSRIPSGIDFALRFSGPKQIAEPAGESIVQDDLNLDADTITLQHQQSLNSLNGCEPLQAARSAHAVPEQLVEPVSPVRPWEDNSRVSAVSPIHERTIGIDETLHHVSYKGTDNKDMRDRPLPGSFPQDHPSPSTPELPESPTKSVRSFPKQHSSGSNSTNGLSLPGDLSTFADTSAMSGSEMVTDLAVRFSLPQTASNVGRPHVISITPSSSPDHDRLKPTPLYFNNPKHERRSGSRNSVTFATEVVSMTENAAGQRIPDPASFSAAAPFNRVKSIMRKASPHEDLSEPKKASRDITKDPKLVGPSYSDNPGNGPMAGPRIGSVRMPRVQEESLDEVNVQGTDRTSESQVVLPARIAAVKAMQERRLQETAETARARRHGHRHNRPLAEVRDLPSLHFSQMDLIDKLNQALDIRAVKSMDLVRRPDFSSIYCPSPQRPQSTDILRGRYTSFFSKPEEIQLDSHSPSETEDDADHRVSVPKLQIEEQTQEDPIDDTENEGDDACNGGLSPDELLNVAVEVNRLSIPSVSGLSERLSELLIPGLKNLQSLQIDTVLGSRGSDMLVSDGEVMRPPAASTDRSSAGLRLLAARAEEIVKNGTHDSVMTRVRSPALDKDLPPLPFGDTGFSINESAAVELRSPHLSSSASAPSDLGKQMIRTRARSATPKPPTTAEEVQQLLPPEGNPIARSGRRTMVLSQLSSRPWNLDENYPWTDNKVEIDLAVPAATHVRSSTHTGIVRLRHSKSLEFTVAAEITDISGGSEPGSSLAQNLDASMSTTHEHLMADGTPHTRKQAVRSLIGSIGRRMGLTIHSVAGDQTRSPSTPPIRSPRIHQASVDITSHKPGDRYPTTSLTPPATFTLDDVRSFFSETSSEKDRTASFRKRLTNLRGVGRSTKMLRVDPTAHGSNTAVPRAHSPDGDHIPDHTNFGFDVSGLGPRLIIGPNSTAHALDTLTMGRTEFHLKRLGEKLRLFFVRGGEMFRSWSLRSGTTAGHGPAPRHGMHPSRATSEDDDPDSWLV